MAYDESAPILTALRGLATPRDLSVFTVSIAAGQAMSTPVDMGPLRLLRIDMPDQWTAARVIPYVSAEGVTYGPLSGCDVSGIPAAWFAAASRNDVDNIWMVNGRPSPFRTARYLKLRSVNDQLADVAQVAARTITLVAG